MCRGGLVFVLLVLLGAGCGDQERRSPERHQAPHASDPGLLVRGLVRSAVAGRWGELWDALEPGDQRLVNRERFVGCLRELAMGAAIPLSEIPVTVVRVRRSGHEAAVLLRAATPVGPATRTIEAVEVEGAWRWRLPRAMESAFATGRCPDGL